MPSGDGSRQESESERGVGVGCEIEKSEESMERTTQMRRVKVGARYRKGRMGEKAGK